MNFHPFLPVFHARSNSTGYEILLKMGVNSLGLHLYASLVELGIIPMNSTGFTPNLSSISCPVEFEIRLVEFDRARNTAQNGSKFTGITLYPSLVELGIIPMNSTEFTPNLSSISCPVKFNRPVELGVNPLRL